MRKSEELEKSNRGLYRIIQKVSKKNGPPEKNWLIAEIKLNQFKISTKAVTNEHCKNGLRDGWG